MDKAAKIKVAIAVVLLLTGLTIIGWYMFGGGSSMPAGMPDPSPPSVR